MAKLDGQLVALLLTMAAVKNGLNQLSFTVSVSFTYLTCPVTDLLYNDFSWLPPLLSLGLCFLFLFYAQIVLQLWNPMLVLWLGPSLGGALRV